VPATYYFESGKKSSEGFLRAGKPDGYWKSYHLNGNLKTEGNRKNYLLDGTWKFYTEEGMLYLTIDYSEDKKQGQRVSYRGEQPYKVERFENDLKQGLTEVYHTNGKVQTITPFDEGREKGMGYVFDEQGTVISLLTYKSGVLVKEQQINRYDDKNLKKAMWMSFYPTMQTKDEGLYVNDLKHGYWKYYKADGNLIRIEKWVHGVLVEDASEITKIDVRREIDPKTGKTASIGGYRNGQKEGVHREYDNEGNVTGSKLFKDGRLLAEGIYDEQGRKQELWKYYYDTGELKETGRYKDGKRMGTWRYLFINGDVEQIGEFRNDLATGTWRWYYENKQLRLEEEYEDGFEEGPSIEYSDSGTVIATGKYMEGFKDGLWEYTIGNVQEKGKYLDGEKQGTWKQTYLDNNKTAWEGEYLNGIPNGMHKWYHANGSIKRRGSYSLGLRDGIWEYFDESGGSRLIIKYERGKEIEYNGTKITYGKKVDRELEEEEQERDIQQ
jgi:antitoxin component YwqK of YwqJK toxin-antitoxin module